jgi:hypothetical protein
VVREKRGWTIQHRPTSNPSKALPDSPGRAARKPAGMKLQFSGTECFSFRTIHGGEWLRETRFQGLLLFWGPAKQDFSKTRRQKIILIAAELAYKLIVIYLD